LSGRAELEDLVRVYATPGKAGLDGRDGLPGRNGLDGEPGPEGKAGDVGPVGPPGQDGTDGEDGQSINWRGRWKSRSVYRYLDAVELDGSSYICAGDMTRAKPPGPSWDLMAQKGQNVGGVTMLARPGGGGGSGGGGSALIIKDEGVVLDSAVTSVDFTGAGVIATNVGHAVTVAVAASGGGIDPANIVYLESSNPVADGAPAVWDTIYDQLFNDITGTGIPASMGVSLVSGDTTVQVDEAGVWWLELTASPATDQTAQVTLHMNIQGDYAGGPWVKLLSLAVNAQATLSSMLPVIAAQIGSVSLQVKATLFGATPTTPGYVAWEYGVLKIVRLA
jgi:hypothetical protein